MMLAVPLEEYKSLEKQYKEVVNSTISSKTLLNM